jgi:hypothetical protein
MTMPNITSKTGEVGTYTYTYIMPGGIYGLLSFLHVIYTASGAAGTRQIVLSITDANDNLITDFHAGTTQTASQERHYNFMKGIYRETSFVNDELQVPIATDIVIEPGWKIVVADTSGTDSATDAMAINFQYEELN